MTLALEFAGWRTGSARVARLSSWSATVDPGAKILAVAGVVLASVATPSGRLAPQLALLALATSCCLAVGVDRRWLRTAMMIELPFALFAVMAPFTAGAPRVDVGPIALSTPGLWSAWALLSRGLVGALCAVALASCTRPHELVAGLERLRLPAQLVSILSFMVRYLDVVTDQWQRMTIARTARGFRARGPRDWLVLARSLGMLFVACYERGERVHLAMVSRGFQGTMPNLAGQGQPSRRWPLLLPVLAAAGIAIVTRLA